MRWREEDAGWAGAFDIALLLMTIFMVAALLEVVATPRSPAAPTVGYYAVVDQWAPGNLDDVDLYVRDPEGRIAYFGSPDAGTMHLEQDDLGAADECGLDPTCLREPNSERTIIRGITPGEYVVDVHLYEQNQPGPVRVRVQLWSLARGAPIVDRVVTLSGVGDWRTAFRFTLSASGRVTNVNEYPVDIVTVGQ